jgi:hypothetical protein
VRLAFVRDRQHRQFLAVPWVVASHRLLVVVAAAAVLLRSLAGSERSTTGLLLLLLQTLEPSDPQASSSKAASSCAGDLPVSCAACSSAPTNLPSMRTAVAAYFKLPLCTT